MNVYELAERDLRKAKINLEQAQRRPNVPLLDLQHLEDLCALREQIVEILQSQKQSEGEWEWFEEWSPSTPEHPRECDDCGWRCGECKTALVDAVGGYWDDPLEKPDLPFCPNCGAKMKGGVE